MAKGYLGIDHGSRRIGLAVATAELKVARPLETLPNDDEFMTRLAELVSEHEITDLVIGRPRNLAGHETAQTRAARAFADELASLDLLIHLQDEALTSELAAESLGVGAAKAEIDRAAAAIILQDYLDGL